MRSPQIIPQRTTDIDVPRTAKPIKKPDQAKKCKCLHASLIAILENFPVSHLYKEKM